jgi:transcriptional regulator with XRE-family HTH domain
MNNNDFAQFLDDIREARNVTREDFVQDIISLRQYYRFIKGESTLRNDVILELVKRLELDNAFFYSYFQKVTDEEFQRLDAIYPDLYLDELEEAAALHKEFDFHNIQSETNRKYYFFLTEILLFKQQRKTEKDAVEAVLALVDYPAVLEKSVLTYMEKNMLVFVSSYLMSQKDFRIAHLFQRVIEQEDRTNVSLDQYSMTFRIVAAKALGYIHENQKAYDILNRGERRFMTNDNYLPLLSLYYFKAIEEHKLFEDDRYRRSLQNLFMLLRLSNNEAYRKRYETAVKRYFSLEESDLIEFK